MYDIFRKRPSFKQRQLFKKFEKSRLLQKGIQRIIDLPRFIRMANTSTLVKANRNGSIVKVRNRCILTNRQRGIITPYHISRLQFRRMSREGLLKGLRQSSW